MLLQLLTIGAVPICLVLVEHVPLSLVLPQFRPFSTVKLNVDNRDHSCKLLRQTDKLSITAFLRSLVAGHRTFIQKSLLLVIQ